MSKVLLDLRIPVPDRCRLALGTAVFPFALVFQLVVSDRATSLSGQPAPAAPRCVSRLPGQQFAERQRPWGRVSTTTNLAGFFLPGMETPWSPSTIG